jgi:hypothetical protein
MLQLPGIFPSGYHYAVGETGIIFVDDTSQSVHAFDINDGQWKTYISLTNATWTGADADGNVAMVWSDSILVAYSTLTHSFSSLQNVGHLINSGATHGCLENFAYVVTQTDWYVFDAEDGQWRIYNYTSPGYPGATIMENVQGKSDYIYLHSHVLNDIPATLVAYSLQTKTFAEKNLDYISNPYLLDHGFTFYKLPTTGPFYCVGYSAFTGNFSMKNQPELITPHFPGYFPEIVGTKIISAFSMHEPLTATEYRRWLWAYNTIIGSFAEYWYIIDYAGTNAVWRGMGCGGQFAVDWVQNVGHADRMECVLYSAATHSFTNFFSPLYFYGGYTSFSPGGNIFDGYDSVRYYIHDVETGADHSTSVIWETGFQPGVKARSIADYWMVFAYRDQFEDTLHVFSYSRETGNFTRFKIRNDGPSGDNHGRDIFWIRVQDSFEPDKILLYSPKSDNWYQKDLTAATFWGGEGSYFYMNNGSLNQMQLFDGYMDQEFQLPSPQFSNHVFARDSVLLMYTNTGKYIGYSPFKHDTSECITTRLSGQNWNNYIVLAQDGSNYYELLLYDGYSNAFAPLHLTTQQGFRRIAWSGGKTALVATTNGYLFAYNPGALTNIDPNLDNTAGIVYNFNLYQNYPNPFNPTTLIKFDLPNSRKTVLKIYNALGQLVETLIDETLLAGPHEYQWEPKNKASGLYFYVLEAGDYRSVKKMILMK